MRGHVPSLSDILEKIIICISGRILTIINKAHPWHFIQLQEKTPSQVGKIIIL